MTLNCLKSVIKYKKLESMNGKSEVLTTGKGFSKRKEIS